MAQVVDPAGRGFGPQPPGPIVGRASEQGELSSALAGARSGRGALRLIVGEAGIGKTRLAEAVAEEAADNGDMVLWGSAWEAGGAPAFWPWTQALRELVRQRPLDAVKEDLGSGTTFVAQIAPELGRQLEPPVEPAPAPETEASRFTAFDATASFLRATAAHRPIVIILDDLHAADVATIRLLEFLTRNLHGARILAVGTHRTETMRRDTDVTAALADLGRAAGRLVLGGLSRDEVRELAAGQASRPPPARLVDRLHALTEGNPLFVDEVMRLLTTEGLLEVPGALDRGRLPVPVAVRETIRRRLDPLQPAVVRALTAAAVIGQQFRLEALARVVGDDRPGLLEHLDAAAEAGLVDEMPGTLGRYRFGHALIRETLYEDLTSQDRIALHAAVGEALVEIHGTGPGAPLSELAHHFLRAAPAGDPSQAAEYAARAGERALESMAYEQAIDSFEDALQALELQPRDSGRRGPVLLALGQAQMSAGRLAAGRATLRRAVDEGRRIGDTELLARAVLASAPWGLATASSDERELIPLLNEALAGVPVADGALRSRLLARLAAALYWTASAERRTSLAYEAIAMARRVGDPATLAFVLSDAHLATWDPDSPERSLPWASEIYSLAEQVGNTELAMAAHSWRISLLLELGRLAVVDEEIEIFAHAAARLHQRRAQAQTLLHRSARALIAGRFDDAERILGEAGQHAALLQDDPIFGMRLAAVAFVMREAQGRLGELEAGVQQFADDQPAMPVWRCGLLSVYLQTGQEAQLRREYQRLAADDFASVPRDNLWLPALALLAEACAHVGDRAGARTLAALLAPYAGRNVVTPDVAYLGPVDRYLGLVAATAGDDDRAAGWFASARELAASMGARPTCARLALDEARTLHERDPDRSMALAAESASDAEAMGLEHLAEQAHALVGRLPTPAPSPQPAVTSATPPLTLVLRHRGDVWEVAGGDAAFHLKDAKGLHHLAHLLAHPGREFHALDLVGAAAPRASVAPPPDPSLTIRGRGQEDAGPLLDDRAKAEYRTRVIDLRQEVDEAEAFHDPERLERARAELEFVVRELSAAVGLHGRDRRAGADAERARVNVTRALRAAVNRISEHDAGLGHHLQTCVRTGTFCVYEPGPEAHAWDIDASP